MSEDVASYGPEMPIAAIAAATVARLQAQVKAYEALIRILHQQQARRTPTQDHRDAALRACLALFEAWRDGLFARLGITWEQEPPAIAQARAALAGAVVTHTEACRKVRCRNTNDAICDLCACTCQPPHLTPRDLSNPCGDGHIWFTLRGLTPTPDERCVCRAVTWGDAERAKETTMSEDTRRDWTLVQENEGEDKTERLRVAGGWLYRVTTAGGSVALTFVPGEDEATVA